MSSIAYDTFAAFIMNEDLLQCMLNFLEIEMHEPYLFDYGYYCCSTQSQNTTLEFKQMDYDPHPNNSCIATLYHCTKGA